MELQICPEKWILSLLRPMFYILSTVERHEHNFIRDWKTIVSIPLMIAERRSEGIVSCNRYFRASGVKARMESW